MSTGNPFPPPFTSAPLPPAAAAAPEAPMDVDADDAEEADDMAESASVAGSGEATELIAVAEYPSEPYQDLSPPNYSPDSDEEEEIEPFDD